MDQFLPTEILAHIAANLSRKDFNCLSRTSKTALWKLVAFRDPLRIEMVISSDNMLFEMLGFDGKLQFEVHLKQERGLRCFKSALCNGNGIITEEDKKAEVQGFYYRNRENPLNWHNAETTFWFGAKEALSHHLRFLLSHNVVIDQLRCSFENTEDLSEIVEQIRGHGTRVNKLVWNADSNLDFMTAIDPQSIEIVSFPMPSEFYQSEVVRKLKQLTVHNHGDTLQEGDLTALTATSIEMRDVKGVTVNDIEYFLKQWLESRRQLEFLKVQMHANVPIATWTAMFSQLNIHPAGFDGIKSGIWRPIRRSDGRKIDFRASAKTKIVSLKT